MDNTSGVQSVERVFAVMEALSCSRGGAQLADIASRTGLPKSTAFRLLRALMQLGYCAQCENGAYRLTLKLFEVASGVLANFDILGAAKPELDALSGLTGEVAHLVVRDGGEAVYVYKSVPRTETSGMASRVGMRSPLYCTAVGKAMLAQLPESEALRLFEECDVKQRTARTITDAPSLLKQLERIREQGYAVDDEENELGIICVGVALKTPPGSQQAAFSISALAPRMTSARIKELARLCMDAASRIVR